MPAGLSITTTTGQVQIDQDYRNLVFISKGSVTFTKSYETGRYEDVTFAAGTVTDDFLLALNSSEGVAIIRRWKDSNNAWNIRLWCPTNNATATWYLFDVAPLDSSISYGMQVRNASGVLVWSAADQRLLKIVNIFSGVRASRNASDTTFDMTLPTGKTYAFIPGLVVRMKDGDQNGVYSTLIQMFMGCVKNISTGLNHTVYLIYENPNGLVDDRSHTRSRLDYQIMAIDVSYL